MPVHTSTYSNVQYIVRLLSFSLNVPSYQRMYVPLPASFYQRHNFETGTQHIEPIVASDIMVKMSRPLVRFKNRYTSATDINSRTALKICNRDIQKLSAAHRYAARLYIKSLFDAHYKQLIECYDTIMAGLKAEEERIRCEASLSQARDKAHTTPKSTRIMDMETITKHWGPDILELLRQNRFQREPDNDLLQQVSSVAKKFPDHDRARRLVNSVIVKRLTDNRTDVKGWEAEAKALDWSAVCKMPKNADTTRLDHDTLSRLKLEFGEGDELVPGSPFSEELKDDN